MLADLRDRLSEGDRRAVGAAGSVAVQVLRDNTLLPGLVALLRDGDTAVVAHTAHALMQVAMVEPAWFDSLIDTLLDDLDKPQQWEIGEQLPKILVRAALSEDQALRLAGILETNTRSKSNIVAACSLQGLIDLVRDGRIDADRARRIIDGALTSDRKALAARARQLQKLLAND